MKVGDRLEGLVTGIKPYGAFVQLDENVMGLVHISEIKTGYIDNIYDELRIGDKVQVQVVDIDDYTQKISLSIRTLEEARQPYSSRHRFSNSRVKTGFAPFKKQMPIWIEESKAYLKERECKVDNSND